MRKIWLILLALILGAVILFPRFYHLGSQPPGLHIDEVSFAADAKSIAETGRDTWGVKFPTIFRAFGEWKAPGLVYSMAAWSKILGRMDNVITRLPSAVAGLVTLLLFGLTLALIASPKPKSALPFLLAVLVLAFSPWHFAMSRIFYEAFSALAIFTISLYFMTRATLQSRLNLHLWIWAAIFASLAGYWYASIRYAVILSLILAILVQTWNLRTKLKTGFLIMLIGAVLGVGWIGDLTSERGLNRLYYYQNKTNEGATLEINEKREYCYLSFRRDAAKTKVCYALWNKPVAKMTGALQTYTTYLGTNFLFLHGVSEFGFDAEYGAYLLPLLPLYLVGLYQFLSGVVRFLTAWIRHSQPTALDRLYTLYLGVALISVLPAAAANNVNMRMGLISLYLISLIIGLGIISIYRYLRTNLPKLGLILGLGYPGLLSFYIVQSQIHYFLVFTHSNDLLWTSDSSAIFGYVKSVSANYEHIVDTELHGPLAPYFYGDITTKQMQEGQHSPPDDFGFTYITTAGKYELRHVNIKDLACEKLSARDNRRTLVITNPVHDLTSSRKFASFSWNGALLLHEVYDLDDVIRHEISGNSSFKDKCNPK